MHVIGRNTTARAATLLPLILVLSGLVYWGLQAAGLLGDRERDVIVRAGAPGETGGPQATPGSGGLRSAMALSAELPVLEAVDPATVPELWAKSAAIPSVTPEPVLTAEAFAAVGSERFPAVAGDDEIGSVVVDVNTADTKDTTESPPDPQEPSPAQMYTWEDGDRTLEVRLDPGLVVQPDSAGISREDIVASTGDGVVVRSDARESLPAKGDPVFWSSSGELMALPGGAVIVLDPSWDATAVDEFLQRHGIDASHLTELDFVANGFFIDTEPGFPSLNLANSLAGQDGVELASPNWWIERVTK